MSDKYFDFSYKSDMDWNAPRMSISNVLEMAAEPFDRERVVELTYNKHFNNPESQYYQKSKDEIVAMWEEKGAVSRKYGSLLDDYIGLRLTGTQSDLDLWKLDNNADYDERLKGLRKSFDDFYDMMMSSGNVEFVDREKSVYYDMNGWYVKGRFDALFRNNLTNKFILIDWKSSGEIEKTPTRWTKKLKGPLWQYPQLNWFTYTMQLHFYKASLLNCGYWVGENKLSPDDITVLIVNLPGKEIAESGKWYQAHNEAYPYDESLVLATLDFAHKKQMILESQK